MHLDTTSLIFSFYKQEGPPVIKPRASRNLTHEVLSLFFLFYFLQVQSTNKSVQAKIRAVTQRRMRLPNGRIFLTFSLMALTLFALPCGPAGTKTLPFSIYKQTQTLGHCISSSTSYYIACFCVLLEQWQAQISHKQWKMKLRIVPCMKLVQPGYVN